MLPFAKQYNGKCWVLMHVSSVECTSVYDPSFAWEQLGMYVLGRNKTDACALLVHKLYVMVTGPINLTQYSLCLHTSFMFFWTIHFYERSPLLF